VPSNRIWDEVKTMTVKEIAISTIKQLPEDASWEDIQERINFAAGVRKGLRELDEGKGIPHERVKEEFREWLSS
jgi:predicted transcriptional regulator